MVTLDTMKEKKIDAINKYLNEALKNVTLKSSNIKVNEIDTREGFLFYNSKKKDKIILKK